MDDVERLRRIQQLVCEAGLNLAGVERVLEMEERMAAMQQRLAKLEAEMDRISAQAEEEVEAVHRSYRKELVLFESPGEVTVVARKRGRRR